MVSVVISALNEATTIQGVIKRIIHSEVAMEIIVVDDSSDDNTIELAQKEGVRVITSSQRGKGVSMREGLLAAKYDVIVYLDADILTYPKNVVALLTEAIFNDEADFVKATFERQAGRVTQLVAKPLLSIFFPELEKFKQPLSGMIAARRSFLEMVEFENDYGVDIGLLIDAFYYEQRIKEVNIGYIRNDMQNLEALGRMARQVSSTVLRKAESLPTRNLETLSNIRVINDEMESVVRASLQKLRKIIIVDISVIMKYDYNKVIYKLCHPDADSTYSANAAEVATLLKGWSLPKLQSIADDIPLADHVRETVRKLKNSGYMCALVSDGFDVIANHIKNKIGFDYAFANRLVMDKSIATGAIEIPAYYRQLPSSGYCKSGILQYIASKVGISEKDMIYVGSSVEDIPLLQASGIGIVTNNAPATVKIWADRLIPAGTLRPLSKLGPGSFQKKSIQLATGAGIAITGLLAGYYTYSRRLRKRTQGNLSSEPTASIKSA